MAATGKNCHNTQPTVSAKVKKSFPKGGESYDIICSLAQHPLSILFLTLFCEHTYSITTYGFNWPVYINIHKHIQYNSKIFATSCESKAQDTLQMMTPIDCMLRCALKNKMSSACASGKQRESDFSSCSFYGSGERGRDTSLR